VNFKSKVLYLHSTMKCKFDKKKIKKIVSLHHPHKITRSFNLIIFLAYTDARDVQNLKNNYLVAICFLHLGVYLVAPHIDKKKNLNRILVYDN
jgi:hypothetical protein